MQMDIVLIKELHELVHKALLSKKDKLGYVTLELFGNYNEENFEE